MGFKVALPVCDDDQVDAVMRGIANGCSELYPLPDHPSKVRHLLGLKSVSNDGATIYSATVVKRASNIVEVKGMKAKHQS